MLEVKQERSRRRFREILDAATRVFAERGFNRTRISMIASAAEVPPSSIYDYFQSKEELLYALPETHFADFFEELEAALAPLESTRDKLETLCRLNLDFVARHRTWARVLFLEVWPSVWMTEQRVRDVVDDFGRTFVALFKEGVAKGEVRPDADPYVSTNIFVGAMVQTINTWLLYDRPRDPRDVADRLIAQLMLTVPPPDGDNNNLNPQSDREVVS